MKVKIVSKEVNPLLKRKEVTFRIEHDKEGGTPTRKEIKEQLATLLKTDEEMVYIKNVKTKTGTTVAVGEANAYESVEQANLIEPKHIIVRNVPPEKPKEAEESPVAEEAEEPEATEATEEEKKKPKKTPEPTEKEEEEL
jgi:small subunit ribosomal protein S24e